MCKCKETAEVVIMCGKCIQGLLGVVGSAKPMSKQELSFHGLTDRQVKKSRKMGRRTPGNINNSLVWA
jgi:hypothetical protein